MTFAVDALALSYTLAVRVAPDGVSVETSFQPDAPAHLPLVVVGTSAASSVANGPHGSSADFTLSIRCYAASRAQAAALCHDMYGGLIKAWQAGTTTEYGWLSSVSRSSTQPVQVDSDLEADSVYRFDCVLQVIARH